MAPQPQVVPIRKLLVLQRGCYFKSCRPYCTNSGIKYDYKLYNWRGNFLPPAIFGKLKDISFLGPCSEVFNNFPLTAAAYHISCQTSKVKGVFLSWARGLGETMKQNFPGGCAPWNPALFKGKDFLFLIRTRSDVSPHRQFFQKRRV